MTHLQVFYSSVIKFYKSFPRYYTNKSYIHVCCCSILSFIQYLFFIVLFYVNIMIIPVYHIKRSVFELNRTLCSIEFDRVQPSNEIKLTKKISIEFGHRMKWNS